MAYSTGVQERDKRLRRAIGEVLALHEQPSLDVVASHLPKDFELEEFELSSMLADDTPDEPPQVESTAPVPGWEALRAGLAHKQMIEETPAGDPLPKTLDKITSSQEFEDAPPHSLPAEATPVPEINEQQARAVLTHSNKRLADARSAMVVATETLKNLRANLSTEIYRWQLLFKPVQQTREQLVRETIAANQQLKQDIKDGKVAPPRHGGPRGRSYIDQTSGRGGSANDFARRYQGVHTTVNGQPVKVTKGARGNAFPSQYQGRTVKVPSDL